MECGWGIKGGRAVSRKDGLVMLVTQRFVRLVLTARARSEGGCV